MIYFKSPDHLKMKSQITYQKHQFTYSFTDSSFSGSCSRSARRTLSNIQDETLCSNSYKNSILDTCRILNKPPYSLIMKSWKFSGSQFLYKVRVLTLYLKTNRMKCCFTRVNLRCKHFDMINIERFFSNALSATKTEFYWVMVAILSKNN